MNENKANINCEEWANAKLVFKNEHFIILTSFVI